MPSCSDRVASLSRQVNRAQGSRDAVRKDYRSTRREAKETRGKEVDLEEALVIAQTVAKETQEALEFRISEIVTMALETVFPDPYQFRIQFEIKRGKTEARMTFLRDQEEVDPLTAAGGGVVDVAAFALRLSCLMITRPAPRKTVVLDEPFRFVSAEYQEKVAELLETLSSRLGVQFIMITHEEALQVGKVVRIEGGKDVDPA